VKAGRSVYEIVAVIATAVLHPVFKGILHQQVLFIALALGGWLAYFGARWRREEGVLQRLGFRKEGLVPAFLAASVFSTAALLVMAVVAGAQQTIIFRWHMLLLLALYPVWGAMQQLLLQGIFVRTVATLGSGILPRFLVTIAAAILFAAVHLPDMRLAGATSLLGAAFTLIYLRWRNLWPLGLYHGWLGVFFYYWVLGRDPWAQLF
jgi:uncharacterized protein